MARPWAPPAIPIVRRDDRPLAGSMNGHAVAASRPRPAAGRRSRRRPGGRRRWRPRRLVAGLAVARGAQDDRGARSLRRPGSAAEVGGVAAEELGQRGGDGRRVVDGCGVADEGGAGAAPAPGRRCRAGSTAMTRPSAASTTRQARRRRRRRSSRRRRSRAGA